MSISGAATRTGRKLGLVSSLVLLLAGLGANGQVGVIVSETFESQTLALFGWEGGVNSVDRQYVAAGAKGTTAAQISANFVESWGYVGTMLYQNGLVTGGGHATPESTTLTFDLKVDRPGLKNVTMALQSWPAFIWGWLVDLPGTSSIGTIPLGAYTPGKFKTISVRVSDPLWAMDSGFLAPFDPSGKTYQVWMQFSAGAELGAYTVTVDNIRVTTVRPPVQWSSASAGVVDPNTLSLKAAGIAEHLGGFTMKGTFVSDTPTGTWDVEITAASGDRLFGTLWSLAEGAAVAIEGGTGRFEGAVGAYIDQLTWTGDTTWNGTASGSISTVGSNK